MPSFDIVSEINQHELTNAVDQANREIDNRFDFKGTNAKFVLNKENITLSAKEEFQLKQMLDVLQNKLAKRNIDIRCLEIKNPEKSLHEAKQQVIVKQGIEKENAKTIIKEIKDSKLKVQGSIQDNQIRVTGKNRDDLQETIALLRNKDFKLPLQFTNFRD